MKTIKFLLFLLLITTIRINTMNTMIQNFDPLNHMDNVTEIFTQSKERLLYPAPWWKRMLAYCHIISPKKVENERLAYTLRYLPNKNYSTKVYVKNNIVVGFINYAIIPSHKAGLIHLIGVDKNYRKQGIASQLIQHALTDIFKNESIEQVCLYVDTNNIGAIKLYNKLGFSDITPKNFCFSKIFPQYIYRYKRVEVNIAFA